MTGNGRLLFKPMETLGWLRGTLPLFLKLPVCVLLTAVLLIVSWIARPLDTRGAQLQPLIRFWAKLMLWVCRIRVKIEEQAPLDRCKQYVFVSNHASWTDIPVLLASVPHRLAFIAKQELFQMPLVGACLRRTGQIAVDRGNSRGFAEGLKRAADALTRENKSVLFFPAGTRVSSGVGQFKDGAAYFAIRAKLPIVPIAIAGTAAAMPRGAMRINGGDVQVTLGTPIETADLTLATRATLSRQLQEEILSLVAGAPV